MSSFLGSSSPGSDSESIKQRIMAQMKQEMAMMNAQELLNSMTKKCYARCITKPSTKGLSSSDETCLRRCMDRYMEAFDLTLLGFKENDRLKMQRKLFRDHEAFNSLFLNKDKSIDTAMSYLVALKYQQVNHHYNVLLGIGGIHCYQYNVNKTKKDLVMYGAELMLDYARHRLFSPNIQSDYYLVNDASAASNDHNSPQIAACGK